MYNEKFRDTVVDAFALELEQQQLSTKGLLNQWRLTHGFPQKVASFEEKCLAKRAPRLLTSFKIIEKWTILSCTY